jgi:hypothetical protein
MMQRRIFLLVFVMLVSIEVFSQNKNTLLDQQPVSQYTPQQPVIAINPKNPKNMVAVAMTDNLYHTMDGGQTWTKSKIQSKYGVSGDPMLVADNKGNFFLAHLANPSGEDQEKNSGSNRIVVQKSVNGGKKWDGGVVVVSGSGKRYKQPRMSIHGKTGTVFLTWTQFEDGADCKSDIMYAQLKWGKGRWTKANKLNQYSGDCNNSKQAVESAKPTVSTEGRVYVAWSGHEKIYLDRSMDGGEYWISNDLVIVDQPDNWEINIPGLVKTNAYPVIKTDNSRGPFRGNLYLLWSDQVSGPDDTDIWMMKSGNGGDNWNRPIRVNEETPGKHQYFPWMSIDPATGIVYVLYFDRGAYDDNRSDVYLAYTSDGANNFKHLKISESPFGIDADKLFGDYTNLSAVNGTIAAIWTRMDAGKSSVWTCIMKDTDLIPELKKQKEEKSKKEKKNK